MIKIICDSESFQQCSYSTLSQDTDNLDLAAVANEPCQNEMLLFRAVLMKFLKIYKSSCFSTLQTTIIIKCTQWCFFEQPLPSHEYGRRINKTVLPIIKRLHLLYPIDYKIKSSFDLFGFT